MRASPHLASKQCNERANLIVNRYRYSLRYGRAVFVTKNGGKPGLAYSSSACAHPPPAAALALPRTEGKKFIYQKSYSAGNRSAEDFEPRQSGMPGPAISLARACRATPVGASGRKHPGQTRRINLLPLRRTQEFAQARARQDRSSPRRGQFAHPASPEIRSERHGLRPAPSSQQLSS